MIKIVVDLLGADKPQTELVLGAIRAISENKDLYVYLMGRKAELEDFLANVTYDESQLEIVGCTQEITNYDDPVDAYHDKTDSSLIKGLKMCRMNEDIGGFVTCGATGVVLISSILILGKLNATRPALSVVLNGRNDKPFCIVDCGANIDCKADRFVDFARLGVAYMKTLGIENPTVATLSNGIEAGKGSDVIKEAHELLEKCGFNFTGNIEGKEVLDGNADVVVCDGFAGNVLLKSIEGTAKVVADNGQETEVSNEGSGDITADEIKNTTTEVVKNDSGNKQETNNAGQNESASDVPGTKPSGESNSANTEETSTPDNKPDNGNNSNASDTTPTTPTVPEHTHTWTPVTTTIHHDATGHYEDVVVGTRTVVDKKAWDEPIYEYVVTDKTRCIKCGTVFNTFDEWCEHSDSLMDEGDYSHGSYEFLIEKIQTGTKYHEEETHEENITESRWVEDTAAYEEKVTSYICSCGATK